jgi:hypothetical protein
MGCHEERLLALVSYHSQFKTVADTMYFEKIPLNRCNSESMFNPLMDGLLSDKNAVNESRARAPSERDLNAGFKRFNSSSDLTTVSCSPGKKLERMP